MTITRARRRAAAFSLIELLCVLAIIGVLAALLLPALSQARARAKRVQCVNHLRQAGIAFQSFAQDHNGQFPMSVPVNAGGSLEFARNAYGVASGFYFSFRHFQALSNELVTPKVVVCPTDTRLPAASFAALRNEAISYFVGISAVPASPESILAGDRNLTNDWATPATLLRFGPNNSLRWTYELHRFKGNLLFADGRVEERNTPGLIASGNQASVVADLALPTVRDSNASGSLGLATGSSGSNPQGPASAVDSTAHPGFEKKAVTSRPDLQSSTNASATRPGWGTDSVSGQSHPDSPLIKTDLPPGTSPNAAATTRVSDQSKAQDPGFSLFPPLLGHEGLLGSAGGRWLLFVLAFLLLVLGSGVLLKRLLAKKPLARSSYHETGRMS